jgi:hypothetical protein
LEAADILLNGAVLCEEANTNCQQQCTILKYLTCYFDQRLTAPLSKICELEEVALMPGKESVDLKDKSIQELKLGIEQP